MLVKTINMDPEKTILPYSMARPREEPAPIAERRGSRVKRRTAVSIIETSKTSRRACMVVLSAPLLSCAPILREMEEETPAPRPLLRPTTTMNMGVTNPTAARASDPRPATQTAFTRL